MCLRVISSKEVTQAIATHKVLLWKIIMVRTVASTLPDRRSDVTTEVSDSFAIHNIINIFTEKVKKRIRPRIRTVPPDYESDALPAKLCPQSLVEEVTHFFATVKKIVGDKEKEYFML